MFVKILTMGAERFHECISSHATRLEGDRLRIEMVMGDRILTEEVDLKNENLAGVYYLNDKGQTVDTLFRRDMTQRRPPQPTPEVVEPELVE